MDAKELIQVELTRIEEEAARQSRLLLEAQDNLIVAHALVNLLKKHGASERLNVFVCYISLDARMILYPDDISDQTLAAIRDARIDIEQVSRGFNDKTTHLRLRGYDNVEVYIDSAFLDWRNAE